MLNLDSAASIRYLDRRAGVDLRSFMLRLGMIGHDGRVWPAEENSIAFPFMTVGDIDETVRIQVFGRPPSCLAHGVISPGDKLKCGPLSKLAKAEDGDTIIGIALGGTRTEGLITYLMK